MNNGVMEVNHYGSRIWTLDGQFHRIDGPAIEARTGTRYWYKNGLLHRVDGPAIEWPDGHKSWWLNSRYYGEDDIPSVDYILACLAYEGMHE